jgi:prepilin-type N-terminal cleavage/methylation domain-containing protein
MTVSKKIKTVHTRGFSLVELLVATALFSIVVAIAASSFLSILNASHQARSLGQLMLEVDFAVEDMSRNVRTGSGFSILPGGSGQLLSFRDQVGRTITYGFDGVAIRKSVRLLNGTYLYENVPLTSPEVRIVNLNFSRTPARSSGVDQPRIIIQVVGEFQGVADSRFFLQTSVTQRELNIE